MRWTETRTCLSNRVCVRCRDRGLEGHAWRKTLVGVFADIDTASFVCPFGKPWNYGNEWHVRVRAWLWRRWRALGELLKVWRHRGLGDTVAAATHVLGFKTCCACNRRRVALNRAVPYGKVVRHGA